MAGRTHRSELAAGVFVISALALAVGVVIWLGAGRFWSPVYQRAAFYADESAGSLGLIKGNLVQVNDAPVGRIASIRFDAGGGRTLYVAHIDRPGVQIRTDGRAQVVTGLVGESRLIVTDRGSPSANLADEAHPVAATGGMDQAMQDLAGAATQLRMVAAVLASQMREGQDGNLLSDIRAISRRLAGASGELETLMARLRPQLDAGQPGSLMAHAQAAAGNVADLTGQLRRQADPQDPDSIMSQVRQTTTAAADAAQQIRRYTREDVGTLLADLRRLNSELLVSARNLGELTGAGKELVAGNRANINDMIDNLTRVSTELKAAGKEIRRSPWRLMYKPKGQELDSQNLYDAARAFADGAEQLDQALAKLSALSPNASAQDPRLQQVRATIEQAFGRFNQAEQALWEELVTSR
jgi:ABC-type transporter Mla subunit MlaD